MSGNKADRTHRIRPRFSMVVVLILLYINSIQGSSYPSLDEDEISLRSLLAGAIRAAEIGGLEVIRVRDNHTYGIENEERNLKEDHWISNQIKSSRTSNSYSKNTSSENMCAPGDFAKTAEFKSHCAMMNSLASAFPDVVIRYKEQYDNCQSKEPPDFDKALKTLEYYDTGDDELVKASDVTVWIAPLDTSKAFEENLLGHVTTMVCVAVKGVPVIGVIHKPFDAKLTYWGWDHHGVSRNLQNRSFPTIRSMIVPRTQLNDVREVQKKIDPRNSLLIVSGLGAGYKSLEVAVKNASLYLNARAVKKYRVCAGAAILTSLGGMMTSSNGRLLEEFGPTGSMDIEDGLSATTYNHKSFYDRHYKTVEELVISNKLDSNIDICSVLSG